MADPRDDVPSPPGSPLPDIQRALDEQYTDVVRKKAHRFAERRVAQMRWSRRPIPKNYAAELVHDAYTSIWLGVRSWNPSESLYHRLRSLIKERTSREMTRAKRYEHVPIDLAANDPEYDAGLEAELAASSFTDDAPLITMRMTRLARQVADEMHRLADDDQEIRAILRCWERGFTEPQDVLALTGLAESRFKHARERILRLAKKLPPELREAVHDLLRSA